MLELPSDLRARLEATLGACALRLLEASAAYALELHADEAGPEHLLCALMLDEDCAAHRAVLHAFADPETIAEEARALAAGILVTGSAASLPFSTGGVLALEGARRTAAQRSEPGVAPAHLLHAAAAQLPPDLQGELFDAGFEPTDLRQAFGAAVPSGAVREAGSLFGAFTDEAKRLLSLAARVARQGGDAAIGPAHLLLAGLASEPALERAGGLSAARARMLLRGRTRDATPPRTSALGADEDYLAFLEGLAPSAGSLHLLARFHAGGTPLLAQLLARHRVTTALLERSLEAFRDPPA